MSECSNAASQQASENNIILTKTGSDVNSALQNQAIINNQTLNNQANADNQSNSRAWDSLNLAVATDSQTLKHLAGLNILATAQTGQTENQQTVSPIRTGIGENLAAGSIPANRAIDASTALGQGVITFNVAAALAAFLTANSAITPVVVNASGGASTPSQTSPKSA